MRVAADDDLPIMLEPRNDALLDPVRLKPQPLNQPPMRIGPLEQIIPANNAAAQALALKVSERAHELLPALADSR
jgi:hypothetical protein